MTRPTSPRATDARTRYPPVVNVVATSLLAIGSIVGAHFARESVKADRRAGEVLQAPYAPSPTAAPFVALGYREVAADVLMVRLIGYFGAYYDTEAEAIASLSEAIVALDPTFRKVYDIGPNAMTIAERGVNQSIYLRSLALLERGMKEFPASWQLPMLAGQIYIQDLQTKDEAEQRAWVERGVLLVESAIRKPNAPIESAEFASFIRTKLGQRDRAIQGLRELLLVTDDPRAREGLMKRLLQIEDGDAGEIASELIQAKARFEKEWLRDRPAVKPSMYLLIGPRIERGFDLTDLATGGQDLISVDAFEPLEALTDPPAAPAPPASPATR
ncbi:MAG: hypothetical protein JWP01_3029 [Myxococcales bacterium]|nr:hypothetical protein [Myxococcales bacterium]